eukprot:7011-Eustigmatos_ZCMA.PRE.1
MSSPHLDRKKYRRTPYRSKRRWSVYTVGIGRRACERSRVLNRMRSAFSWIFATMAHWSRRTCRRGEQVEAQSSR